MKDKGVADMLKERVRGRVTSRGAVHVGYLDIQSQEFFPICGAQGILTLKTLAKTTCLKCEGHYLCKGYFAQSRKYRNEGAI